MRGLTLFTHSRTSSPTRYCAAQVLLSNKPSGSLDIACDLATLVESLCFSCKHLHTLCVDSFAAASVAHNAAHASSRHAGRCHLIALAGCGTSADRGQQALPCTYFTFPARLCST